MEQSGMEEDGKVQLFDGRTGEPFKERTTVGIIYMLKLHHQIEDKLHARSVGPYSMITQQPLGGKAQNGGQRFGEMECWAIQGYGAANILQENLTIKSDDITGRTQTYRAIVKNEPIRRPSVPESFHVMLKELQALNIKVELMEAGDLRNDEEVRRHRMVDLESLDSPSTDNKDASDEKKPESVEAEAPAPEEKKTPEPVVEEATSEPDAKPEELEVIE